MMGAAIHRSASALPLDLIAQAVPKLSRHDLEALTERLIDRLDELDPDPDAEACGWNERPSQARWPRNRQELQHDDIEQDDIDSACDDYGIDDAEQGDVEDDRTRELPRGTYGTDQRIVCAMDGSVEVYRH